MSGFSFFARQLGGAGAAGKLLVAMTLFLAVPSTVGSANAATQLEPFDNTGFEQVSGGGIVPDWTIRGRASGTAAVVNEPVFAGSQSLRIDDTSKAGAIGAMSARIPTAPDTEYSATVQIYVRSGTPTLYLYFYDAGGNHLKAEFNTLTAPPPQQWTPLELQVTAPPGTASAAIYVYSSKAQTATFYVDNAEFRKTFNSGFEQKSASGAIPDWTVRGGTSGIARVVSDRFFAGSHSLRIEDTSTAGAFGVASARLPATQGTTYTASAYIYAQSGTPTIYVYFYDAGGKQLRVETSKPSPQPPKQWSLFELRTTAPPGSTSAAIYLYSSKAQTGTFYADNVTVRPASKGGMGEDLGVAFNTKNVRLAETDVLDDGTPIGYLLSDGMPISFNVIDLRTGALRDRHVLEGYSIGASITVSKDHVAYFSVRGPNDGNLWSYNPTTMKVDRLSTRIAGETMVRELEIFEGVLYGTTYPNAKLFAMDLRTGAVRDLGAVTADGDYAWAIEFVNDQVWVGTGTVPHIIKVNPVTGAKSEHPLPLTVTRSADFITDIRHHGNLTLVTYSPAYAGTNTALYDNTTGGWSQPDLDGVPRLWAARPHEGRLYYLTSDTIRTFDLSDGRTGPLDNTLNAQTLPEIKETTSLSLVSLGTPTFPSETLIGITKTGQVWRYNLARRSFDVLRANIVGSPAKIHSVGHGADGKIYVGAYLSSGTMARVNPQTAAVEQLSGPTQADSIVAHGSTTVVGTYPGAGIYVGNSETAWSWGTNPAHLFTLGRDAHGQDRPVASVSADSVVAVGTIPDYGSLGGALTIFDPARSTFQVHRNIVPDQSITALTYRNGLLFGGTSIHGGLSSTPTASQARLFVWDLISGRLVSSVAAPAGTTVVHALAFDGNARLWGLADNGLLFEYDVVARRVTRQVPIPARAQNDWGRSSELYLHPTNGLLYGNAGGQLFSFDTSSATFHTLVAKDVQHSAIDTAGTIYYASDTNLFRFVP